MRTEEFEMYLNGLFFNRLEALRDYAKHTKRVLEGSTKREILEKSACDIMFDLERLTDSEKTKFDARYGKLFKQIMEQIAMLPPPE